MATDPAGVVLTRQPMVDPELWQTMAMLPPQERPTLVWPGDYFAAALLAEAFPHYRILGLLRHTTVRYEADLTNCEPEDP